MSKLTEETKTEIIKALVRGEMQLSVAKRFGYSSSSTISRYMSIAKAMIKDYASSHTVEETLEQYKGYELTEKWLADNGIDCFEVEEVQEIPEQNGANNDKTELPQLRTGDIVYVKSAKYAIDKDITTATITTNRPAIVISPQPHLNREKTHCTVLYGTTKNLDDTRLPEWVYFKTFKYYTGVETFYDFSRIDTIPLSDILPPEEEAYAHLNGSDYAVLKRKLGNYFGGKFYEQDNAETASDSVEEITDEEVEKIIVLLFEGGYDRNVIYDALLGTAYESERPFIQSTLDKKGYGGVKRFSPPETEPEHKEETDEDITALTSELIELRAKLSVYEKIFTKVNSISL